MRKYGSFSSIVLLAAMSLQSCNFFRQGGAGESTDSTCVAKDSLEFCTVMYEDTLTVGESIIQQSMKVDFPVPEAEGPTADSIRAYLVQAISDRYYPMFDETSVEHKTFTYEIGQEQAFLSANAGEGMTQMVASVNQANEEGWNANYENSYVASMSYQTDKLITYDESYTVFTGGAHGLFYAWGTTFRKSDGKKMGWNLFDMSKKAELIEAIKLELRSYFAVESDADPISEKQLMEELQVWDNPETPENELEFGIPLPNTVPYVTREGIAFVYQQYEIACYACGLPSGILSLDKVRDMLSEEGRDLLGIE